MARRNTTILITLAALAFVIGAAAYAAFVLIGGSGEASETLIAPTLDRTPEVSATQAGGTGTEEASQNVLFEIQPADSSVEFEIYEELRGVPVDVIGRTNEVGGQVLIDFNNPSASEIGTIRINMRTLRTDSPDRDRAIRGIILQTAQPQNEFSDFVPTTVTGFPETVTIGQPFEIQLTGDFTLIGNTRPVTFNVTVTPVSETEVTAVGVGTVTYADYGITIPDLAFLANVGDTVELRLNLVLRPVAS